MNDLATARDVVSAAQVMLRGGIASMETALLSQEQAPCPVAHHFGPGLYIREVTLPAGIVAIGHHQKREHLNVMLKGRVLMIEPDGRVIELRAPQTFVGQPGRKVGYVIEEVVWQNVYATEETDVDELERTYLDKSEGWKQNEAIQAQVAHAAHAADRQDFALMLQQLGIDPAIVHAQSNELSDQMPFPEGNWRVRVHESPIHGKGVFATYPFNPGELIAPARIAGLRTPAGRYTNHSANPNAVMVMNANGDIDLVAASRIEGCRGGDQGSEITINYRQALSLANRQEKKPCLA